MSLQKRHAIPATLLSTGRTISGKALDYVGPAEALTGLPRHREVYVRFRKHGHSRRVALKLTFGAWRFGVILHGERVSA